MEDLIDRLIYKIKLQIIQLVHVKGINQPVLLNTDHFGEEVLIQKYKMLA